ncbi:prepilin-type N-terminal cleavage/methylation domain-containing protein [Acinetobacter johnsonii]|uniref:Prepilin-type N-terminal cleavage/methylation domain-containing protein n=1 Tax=Acinetobacter johnsonii TaxID=40214 RepID=A0AA42ICX5_ACIJO|nr:MULTISPECIES: prepilin-type N-terminal cleavage/methylation domain-containing protein [Acinetobacter]MDH0655612.1 prepilin-type N-terminal cleavage/methylation domain-containing protein [Acinetobacter johnsonii]
MQKRYRGFTLIELMVTIAIMVIIAMMAAPSFADMLAKQRLNSTTKELMETLTKARNQAVLLRTTTTVNLNTTGTNTSIVYFWSPAENTTLTSPTSLSSINFRSDGTTSSIASDTSFVVCSSSSLTTKTFSLSVVGNTYVTPQNDGDCS